MKFKLTEEILQEIHLLIEDENYSLLIKKLNELHPADIAEIIKNINIETAITIIKKIKEEIAAEILIELEDDIREKILFE